MALTLVSLQKPRFTSSPAEPFDLDAFPFKPASEGTQAVNHLFDIIHLDEHVASLGDQLESFVRGTYDGLPAPIKPAAPMPDTLSIDIFVLNKASGGCIIIQHFRGLQGNMLRWVMVELCVGAAFVLDPRGVHAQTSLKALGLMLEALGGEQLKHSSWAGLCTIPPCGNLFDRLPGGRLTGWAVNIWPGTAHRAGPCSVHVHTAMRRNWTLCHSSTIVLVIALFESSAAALHAIAPVGPRGAQRAPNTIDDGYDFIIRERPRTTEDLAQLRWIANHIADEASPIFGWSKRDVKEAIETLGKQGCLAKTQT